MQRRLAPLSDPRGFLLALALLASIAQPGCGSDGGESSGDGASVTTQVKRFYAALAQRDGETACGLLTDKAAGGFEAVLSGRVERDCAANIETLARRSILRGAPEVTLVSRGEKTAAAHVAFDEPPLESDVLLAREDGSWKLVQIPAVVEGLSR